MNRLKSRIEGFTGDKINTKRELEAFKQLYMHGELNEDSPPVNSKKLIAMGKELGMTDIECLDADQYVARAKNRSEPKHCIIFIRNPKSFVGHFTAAYTDDAGVIQYQDSLGGRNSNDIVRKIRNAGREIVSQSSAVQNKKTSNCGYISLLFLLGKKMPSVKQDEITK